MLELVYADTDTTISRTRLPALNRPHALTAEVEMPPGGATGVVACVAGVSETYYLYVEDDRLCFLHTGPDASPYGFASAERIPAGRHLLRYEFALTGSPDLLSGRQASGRHRLYIDGKLMGQMNMPLKVPLMLAVSPIPPDVVVGSQVTETRATGFPFTGKLYNLACEPPRREGTAAPRRSIERVFEP